jgi:hypothetical protein
MPQVYGAAPKDEDREPFDRLLDYFLTIESECQMRGITKRVLAVGIIAIALSIWILGCGDSGDSGTSGPLTKTQFLKEGDKICKARLEEKDSAVKTALEESGAAEGKQPSKQQQKELGESILSSIETLTNEFSELSPPSGDKAAVAGITAKLEAGLKKAEADPVKLLRIDPFSNAAEAARDYGLTTCNL